MAKSQNENNEMLSVMCQALAKICESSNAQGTMIMNIAEDLYTGNEVIMEMIENLKEHSKPEDVKVNNIEDEYSEHSVGHNLGNHNDRCQLEANNCFDCATIELFKGWGSDEHYTEIDELYANKNRSESKNENVNANELCKVCGPNDPCQCDSEHNEDDEVEYDEEEGENEYDGEEDENDDDSNNSSNTNCQCRWACNCEDNEDEDENDTDSGSNIVSNISAKTWAISIVQKNNVSNENQYQKYKKVMLQNVNQAIMYRNFFSNAPLTFTNYPNHKSKNEHVNNEAECNENENDNDNVSKNNIEVNNSKLDELEYNSEDEEDSDNSENTENENNNKSKIKEKFTDKKEVNDSERDELENNSENEEESDNSENTENENKNKSKTEEEFTDPKKVQLFIRS